MDTGHPPSPFLPLLLCFCFILYMYVIINRQSAKQPRSSSSSFVVHSLQKCELYCELGANVDCFAVRAAIRAAIHAVIRMRVWRGLYTYTFTARAQFTPDYKVVRTFAVSARALWCRASTFGKMKLKCSF